MSDLISVIIPVYKVEKYLNECVDSVLNQTYDDLQIILVDDGSPDKCGSICDDYALKDSRVEVIHKENGGLSSARNAGLDKARGEYIVFIDSDDYIDLKYIETMYSLVKNNDADMAVCNLHFISESGEKMKWKCTVEDAVWTADEFWLEHYKGLGIFCVISCNKIYRSDLFDDLRFVNGKYHEDEFIIDSIVSECSRIAVTDTRLYYYRQRSGSITNSDYSIKNFDGIEAVSNRCQKFMTGNVSTEITNYVLFHLQRMISEAYVRMNKDDEKIRVRYKQYKKIFLKLSFHQLIRFRLSFKYIVKLFLFVLNNGIIFKIAERNMIVFKRV